MNAIKIAYLAYDNKKEMTSFLVQIIISKNNKNGLSMKLTLILSLTLCLSFFCFGNELNAQETVVSHEYSRALHYITEKKYNDALEILKKLEVSENQAEQQSHIYYQIALCYSFLNRTDDAIQYAEKSIRKMRSFEKPYLLLFDLYNDSNRFDDSTYVLHNLVEFDRSHYEHYFTLGIMYGKYIKNNYLSRYCFEHIIKISKKKPVPSQYLENSYLYLSSIYFEEEENVKAIDALNMAAKYNPDHNSRFYNVANYYISKNMLHEAVLTIRYFVDNLTEDQKKEGFIYKIYAFLGRMYYLQDKKEAMYYLRLGARDTSFDGTICRALFEELAGNNRRAEEELLKIVEKNDGYISPYYALAKIMDKKGKKAEAHDYYITTSLMLYNSGLTGSAKGSLLKALSIKPAEPKTHELLARLYEAENKYASALYHYKKSDPELKDIDKIIHIAFLYYYIDNHSLAREMVKKGYSVDQNNDRLYFIDGIVLYNQNEYKDSIQQLEKAISISAENPEYYFYLAMSQDKMDLYDETVVSIKRAMELDDKNPDYYNYLGYLYADKNINLEESEKLLNTALRAKPFNGAYLDSMGWLKFRQGDYKNAERYLVRAYRNLRAVGMRDSVVYDHLGDIYEKTGDKRMALRFWKMALSLDKQNEQIRKKIED